MKVRCESCNKVKDIIEEGKQEEWYCVNGEGFSHKGQFCFGKFFCTEDCFLWYVNQK